jgi:hypothetical protein
MSQIEQFNQNNNQYKFKQEPTIVLLPETSKFTIEELQNLLKEDKKKVIYCPETKNSQSSFSNQANEFLASAIGARVVPFRERAFESSLSNENLKIYKSKNSEVMKQMRIQKLNNQDKSIFGFVPSESYFESGLSDYFEIKGSPISSKLNIALIIPDGLNSIPEFLDKYLRTGLISTKYPRLTEELLSKILTPKCRIDFNDNEICSVEFGMGYDFRRNLTTDVTINYQNGGNEGEIVSGNAIAIVDIVGTGKTANQNKLKITDCYIQLPGMLFVEAI